MGREEVADAVACSGQRSTAEEEDNQNNVRGYSRDPYRLLTPEPCRPNLSCERIKKKDRKKESEEEEEEKEDESNNKAKDVGKKKRFFKRIFPISRRIKVLFFLSQCHQVPQSRPIQYVETKKGRRGR